MPHNENHNPFIRNYLTSDNYNSINPQDTIYTIPVVLYGETKYGGDIDTSGDGANVRIFLKLRCVFGRYNTISNNYGSIIEVSSNPQPNEIDWGRQVGYANDLGNGAGGSSQQGKQIEIPTATEILSANGFSTADIDGMELLNCEITSVYSRGNFNEARVKISLHGGPALKYPSTDGSGVTERGIYFGDELEDIEEEGGTQIYEYWKEPLPFTGGYGGGQNNYGLIDSNSISSNTYIRQVPDNQLSFGNTGGDLSTENEESQISDSSIFTEEFISSGFGVAGVGIEQTLKDLIDAYSGIFITAGINRSNNTELYFNESNEDKRIPLGMFFFNEDNLNSLNLPIKFSDEKFKQIPNINLINNGDCKKIQKKYTDINGDTSIAIKPDGGWHFLNLQGIYSKTYTDENLDEPGNLYITNLILSDEESFDNAFAILAALDRESLSKYYIQSGQLEDEFPQGQYGYGGFYPYIPLGIDLSGYFELISKSDLADVFYDQASSTIPEIATWIDFSLADEDLSFSNRKCLVFSGTSNWEQQNIVSGYAELFNSIDIPFPKIAPGGDTTRLEHILQNKYRVLNQTQKIYDMSDDFLNPYSSLKVKFKMKTTITDTNESPPEVEVGIINRNLHTTNIPANSNQEARDDYMDCRGGFNSYTYPNTGDINKQLASEFGGMIRVRNKVFEKWEDFEFDYSLTNHHMSSYGKVNSLNFFIQSTNNFSGQVMLDNFEVLDSADFYPDCDVRKKISVGNYGIADLTKYYDPTIPEQLEAYKDTTGPLEAQFYFYPQYPSQEILGVNRTPIYQEFKKGLFYIYDVDWGDGTSKEFISEPTQIDEETALYHTYEVSGIFEVVGYMLRLKEDRSGNIIGLISNKKFKLRININSGLDEDFPYLNSEGFQFFPLKNSLPIVGGYSNQSIYYKTIKRLLGFIDDEGDTRTGIKYSNIDTKFKLETALLKMDESFKSKLEDDSTGGVIPYFNEYNNVTYATGDTSVIRGKEEFYTNTLNLSSPDIFSSTTEGAISLSYSVFTTGNENPFLQGLWWLIELDVAAAQAFEQITGTQGMSSGYIVDLNPGLIFQNIEIADTDISADTGFENLYFAGIYDIDKVYKVFDGESYKIAIKSEGFSASGYVDFDLSNNNVTDLPCRLFFWTIGLTENFLESDIFNDGTNIQGIPLYNWNLMNDDDKITWMRLLRTLPFPKYFQEYDFFGSANISDIYNDINLTRWATLGRYDIFYYLSTMRTALNQFGETTFSNLIQLTYDTYNFDNAPYLDNVQSQLVPPDDLTSSENNLVYSGLNPLLGELGKSIGDCDLTNIKYYSEPKPMWEMLGFDNESVGIPNSLNYWKNIIPQDYSIYNREGLDGTYILPNSQQDWLEDENGNIPYYPVLPKYGTNGKFIEGDYPNNKIPFSLEGPITDENESNKNLLINITSEKIESNVLDDKSGMENIGFTISDYKPKFNLQTLKPLKTKTLQGIKSKSKSNGAF